MIPPIKRTRFKLLVIGLLAMCGALDGALVVLWFQVTWGQSLWALFCAEVIGIAGMVVPVLIATRSTELTV